MFTSKDFKKDLSDKFEFQDKDSLSKLVSSVNRIMIYPPFERTIIKNDDYMNFAFLAAEQNKPVTTGYVARFSYDEFYNYRDKEIKDSLVNSLVNNSLYITNDNNLYVFINPVLQNKAVWFKVGEYNCILNSNNVNAKRFLDNGKYIKIDLIVEFLRKYKDQTVIMVAMDEATRNLSEIVRNYLQEKNSKINSLAYRGSYISIIRKGNINLEVVNNESAAILNYASKTNLNGFIIPKQLEIHSAGATFGNYSKILINGQEFSPNKRGINLVSLDDQMNVIETKNIDTHLNSLGILYEAK